MGSGCVGGDRGFQDLLMDWVWSGGKEGKI